MKWAWKCVYLRDIPIAFSANPKFIYLFQKDCHMWIAVWSMHVHSYKGKTVKHIWICSAVCIYISRCMIIHRCFILTLYTDYICRVWKLRNMVYFHVWKDTYFKLLHDINFYCTYMWCFTSHTMHMFRFFFTWHQSLKPNKFELRALQDFFYKNSAFYTERYETVLKRCLTVFS